VVAARIAFAAAALLLAAVAAALLWVTFAGPFTPVPLTPSVAPPQAARSREEPPPVVVRRRPPEQARPFHDAIRAGYQAGKYREEDVLGAIHALYHEYGTEEAHALAKDLEKMIGMEESP
jgi:hypothetical protein